MSVYFVSKTCLLISFKISSKIFFIRTCSKVTNYRITSSIQLFSTNWFVIKLSNNLGQLLYNGSSVVTMGYLSFSPCCRCYFMVSINESHRHFFSLLVFFSFGFNRFPFFQHLLLWLLTMSSDNSYHID